MSQKRLAARRARNRAVAAQDVANRCAFCKRALPRRPYVVDGDVRKFCGPACVWDAADADGLLDWIKIPADARKARA